MDLLMTSKLSVLCGRAYSGNVFFSPSIHPPSHYRILALGFRVISRRDSLLADDYGMPPGRWELISPTGAATGISVDILMWAHVWWDMTRAGS